MTITEPVARAATSTTPTTEPDPVSKRPTRDEVIAAIVAEASCTSEKAEKLIDFLRQVRSTSRYRGRFHTHHLNDDEIEAIHDVLDVVMPDNARPNYGDGSAHDMINRHTLDTDAGESTWVHGKTGNVVQYCTVTTVVETVG